MADDGHRDGPRSSRSVTADEASRQETSQQDASQQEEEAPDGFLARVKKLGPGLLVAAAFLGPGTVTTASVAGADYAYALVWTIVFGVVAAIVLQGMSARLGVVSRQGLGEAMRSTFSNPVLSWGAVVLVIAAIGVGTAAFETGNLIGAALALSEIVGGSTALWALVVAALAFGLLASGSYQLVERVLIWLVVLMGVVFLVTAVVVTPDVGALLGGLVPGVPDGATLTVVALVGTTVVPYNLFLHSSSVQDKWPDSVPTRRAVVEAETDTRLSIGLGGLVTLAVLTTAAAALGSSDQGIESAADMAEALEPLLGEYAKIFFAVGLLAAGVTSSVTAPLAAAYATAGALGWPRDLSDRRFQGVWALIIVIGAGFAVAGSSPVAAIVFAQAANGVILPLVAVFLLFVMNREDLLGEYRNGRVANVLGGIIVLVAFGLGANSVLSAFGVVG